MILSGTKQYQNQQIRSFQTFVQDSGILLKTVFNIFVHFALQYQTYKV
jgi:hypothetical protein